MDYLKILLVLLVMCSSSYAFKKKYDTNLYFSPDGDQLISHLDEFSANTSYNCTLEMFNGNKYAYWACITQNALQQNWFPSPLIGLETYLNWNGMSGFWQDGSVLESMANYIYYGNHTRYKNILMSTWRNLDDLLHAYHPQPSFDDEAWFGLAYARIYEITGNSSFLDVAFQVYNWTWALGWDTTGACHGGFWFDGRYSKKITITNAQMLLLGCKLYRLDPKRDPTLPKKIQQTWDYIINNKLINYTTHLIADEIEIYDNCSIIPKYNITYNQGIMIGALAEMYKMSKDQGKLQLAYTLVEGARKYFTIDDILTEYCDPGDSCKDDLDAKMFKGIFMRNVRYLMDISNDTIFEDYLKWIQLNAGYAYNHSQCVQPIDKCKMIFIDGPSKNPPLGPVFGTSWRGPYDPGRPIQQTSTLDLFVSAMPKNVTCKGDSCDFNPPVPNIVKIDCKVHHCPPKYSCCTWDKTYHTCCVPGQECYDGGCY